jgi:hypothetical protein
MKMSKFDFFVKMILESFYDRDEEEREEETMKRAMVYFNIGHHGSMDEDNPDEVNKRTDFCWIYGRDGLKVGTGATHNATFGYDVVDQARFKGWFDTDKNLISFYDQDNEVKDVDEIPSIVYNKLVSRFKTDKFKIF